MASASVGSHVEVGMPMENLAEWACGRHDRHMCSGRRPSIKPDLFSTTSDREPVSPSAPSQSQPVVASLSRHVLPRDLPNAIKQLDDQELDCLLAAVIAEQRRRGVKSGAAAQPSQKQRREPVGVHLTTGKLNAVRAAFAAGIKPTQIARQFGLSDADVRMALASDHKKKR